MNRDKQHGELKRLVTCDTAAEAYLIKGRLNNEGIECAIINENISTLMPMFNSMLGSGIQVLVNESDLEAAKAILDKTAEEPEEY